MSLELDVESTQGRPVVGGVAPVSGTSEMRCQAWRGGLPWVVRPTRDPSIDNLVAWMHANHDALTEKLRRCGALLFRGFAVENAVDFERVARGLGDELKRDYLGTSPRNALTSHVFSASELPGYYPIPQHCEMTFLKSPPRRLFFSCFVPSATGGETPLCDFRKVYAELDPSVRQRFIDGGIRIIRNYAGPETRSSWDSWKLKRWDEMFQTTDRSVVEERCRQEGFVPSWGANGTLRLVSTQPAMKLHPETGEPVWYNHSQVFHLSSAPAEYRRIFALRGGLRELGLWQLSRALVALKRATVATDEQALHCTYADGREIPEADMEAVRDAIWRNLVAFAWERGDVVAIDNASVSHGRLPYRGPRTVAVAWA